MSADKFDTLLNEAVAEAKRKAPQRSKPLYGTWSQHISTNGKVRDELKTIVNKAGEDWSKFEKEFDSKYGSGSEGNYTG